MLGTATLSPAAPMIAGQIGTWRLTYTAGDFGLDDSGAILIARRAVSDWGLPQMDRPGESGYTVATTDGDASLRIWYEREYYIRPWRGCTVVRVCDGSLRPGERIVVTFGDTSGGGPGIRCQTFAERRHRFRVMEDPFGTGRYQDIERTPIVTIVPAGFSWMEVIAPSFVCPGEAFIARVRTLDKFGNVTPEYAGPMTVIVDLPDGPARFCGEMTPSDGGVAAIRVGPLPSGTHRLLAQTATGQTALSNPILCAEQHPVPGLLWGDLHGQTEATVGTGTVQEYFAFARDKGFLDVCTWQGNDFQISKRTWDDVRRQTKRFYQPGHFVTFLGYEYSALTPNGGDHNIFYLDDEPNLLHSAKCLVEDYWGEVRVTASELWESLKERGKVMAQAHVGGRYANFDFYDPDMIPIIEIHSHHGTFEWFAEEALRRGMMVGFTAGSDDHTGRPGLSLPTEESSKGFVSFDVRGGLVGIYAGERTRESIWQALWDRRCYATSGVRILLWTEVDGRPMGAEYAGDGQPKISGWVEGTDSVWEVQIRRGAEVIHRVPLMQPIADQPTRRVIVEWSGVRVKSRAKITVSGARILAAEDFAIDRTSEGIQEWSADRVSWLSSTSGDVDGVILDLDAEPGGEIRFESGPISFCVAIDELTWEPRVFEAGGVNQKVRFWLIGPDRDQKSVEFSYRDTDPQPGLNSYWVRVLQRDGHMAWSSPVYYRYEG